VAWTLGIEVQFYLVAPFIVSRRIQICVAILAAAVGLRLWLVWIHYDRYTYAPAVWCFFLMGHVSHRLTEHISERALQRIGWAALALLPALGYLSGLFHPQFSYPDLDRIQYWVFYVGFAIGIPALFAVSKSWRLDRNLGELSYPVYISHLLVLGVASQLNLPFPRNVWLLCIVTTISGLLYLFVQRPIDAIRRPRPAVRGKLSLRGAANLSIDLASSIAEQDGKRTSRSYSPN
jgi:peptidoglycan/LPS O-acetylase OafA/YrhL